MSLELRYTQVFTQQRVACTNIVNPSHVKRHRFNTLCRINALNKYRELDSSIIFKMIWRPL